MLHTMEITTSKRDELRDITREVISYVKRAVYRTGLSSCIARIPPEELRSTKMPIPT